MKDETLERIARGRERLLYDVSPEALARGERERAHFASWGTPKRCETGHCATMGECLYCWAINGETCRATVVASSADPRVAKGSA